MVGARHYDGSVKRHNTVLFEEVGANRIEARHDPANPASGEVMKKCGMRYEATLRQAAWSNAGIYDTAIYSILLTEYNLSARRSHQ